MKKWMAFFLTVCLLLALAGCGKTPAPENTQNTGAAPSESEGPTTSETEPQPTGAPSQEIMFAVCVPTVTETVSADSGAPIFQYIYQSISMTLPDPDAADRIVLDFLTKADSTADSASTIAAQAKANYTGAADWTPYLHRVVYEPMRIDAQILSFFGSVISYSGAPHPEHTYPCLSYDILTGEALTLPRILAIDDAGTALCDLVTQALVPMEIEKYLYPDYAATVKARFADDLSGDNGWYFSPTGLCFCFEPYEIAPYASGVVVAEIPYGQLDGVIADAYLPDGSPLGTGEVTVSLFDPEGLDGFTQFPEVVLEQDGQQLLLHTEGAVYDVRLQVGGLSYNGLAFEPDYTAFACRSLTPGDALLVEAVLPEDAPRLQLTYSAGGETVSLLPAPDGSTFSLPQ